MKTNLPVTNDEYLLPADHSLISSTDTKGRITDCNDEFELASGFSRDELIGKAHNIIRHPDMPPAAFANMWTRLKEGKAWMGLVKNRRKDGGFYWVNAFVTPVFEKDEIVGYESVRVAPKREDIKRAEKIYSRLNKNKSANSIKGFCIHYGLKSLPIIAPGLPLIIGLHHFYGTGAAFMALGASVLAAVISYFQFRREWNSILNLNEKAFTDNTIASTYYNAKGKRASAKLSHPRNRPSRI